MTHDATHPCLMRHSACSSCCLTSPIWLEVAWSLALVTARRRRQGTEVQGEDSAGGSLEPGAEVRSRQETSSSSRQSSARSTAAGWLVTVPTNYKKTVDVACHQLIVNNRNSFSPSGQQMQQTGRQSPYLTTCRLSAVCARVSQTQL